VVRKVDAHTIVFQPQKTYGVGERLFDGLAICPGTCSEKPYRKGSWDSLELWRGSGSMGGLGPFRMKEYVAGQRLVLERNPYYWKWCERKSLAVFDELVFLFVPNADAQV